MLQRRQAERPGVRVRPGAGGFLRPGSVGGQRLPVRLHGADQERPRVQQQVQVGLQVFQAAARGGFQQRVPALRGVQPRQIGGF